MTKDDESEREEPKDAPKASDTADADDASDEPKPEAKKEEPKPEAKKEEPKPEAKKEEPKPEAKKEEPKPEAKKEEPKPEAKKGDVKNEQKKSADKKAVKTKSAAREAVSVHPPATHGKSDAADHGHHKPDRRQYVVIFGWLFLLTVLEVGVAYTQGLLGKTVLVTALVGLALSKAGCVALFYMHLKHETKVMRWTVALPLLFPALYAFILIAEGIYRSLWGGGA